MTFKNLIERLSDLQIRRPWVPLMLVAAVTCVLGGFATRLELRTRYDALLPEEQASVKELRRVEARTASAQTLLILLEGHERETLRAMGDAVVAKLLTLGPETISSAEDGTQAARAFLSPRAGLFLKLDELERLESDVNSRWDYEVAKESGQLLDDNGPPVTVEDIEKRLRGNHGEEQTPADKDPNKRSGKADDDGSGGYYERKDGTGLVVVAHSPIPGGELDKTGAALARAHQAVDAAKASRPEFADVHVGYAGDMATGFIEYDVVRNDLLHVGATGIGLVLLAVLLYFMRFRALLVMGITIGIGLVWTLGVTQLVIGHLNVATGFLISIVAGNGINVGILYQSRYFEERRQGASTTAALRTAVLLTWQPTVIAALAAVASYMSLLVTDFRAFRQFGFIAATGMLLCWVVKTLMVPPLLLLLDRRSPLATGDGDGLLGRIRHFGMGYGRIFAWIVPRATLPIFAAGVFVVIAGSVFGVRYIREDPMEYNLDATDNDSDNNPELHRVWSRVIDILGAGNGGMVILADTPEDAHELQTKLKADWDAAPKDRKPFVAVHSLWDMVPENQETKVPILLRIGERLTRARARGFLTDADWAKAKEIIPPENLTPFGLADLPEPIARGYSEKDGTRGRLVSVEHEPSKSNDVRYLFRYADSFRETKLASGKIVYGSGRDVIFTDILGSVIRDTRKALALSLSLTLLTVLVAFRRGGWHALSVLFALLVGIGGLVTFLYFDHVRINFMNFSALPITFGIGVDYAINVAQRYRADGSKDIIGALRTTGGAVVLCSLTTTLSYLALLGSHNRGIRSLGLIAVMGEVSCLLAAMTVLPALWLLIERRRTRSLSVPDLRSSSTSP